MTETKLSDYMVSPQLDECTGRLLSKARELEEAGYAHRHLALAAHAVALHHAQQMEGGSCRFTLEFFEQQARRSLKLLNDIRDEWIAAGEPEGDWEPVTSVREED